MPKIHGILETALNVADLQKSADFYRQLFNFNTLFQSDRLIALDVAGRSVLLLFQAGATDNPVATPGGIIPGHRGSGAGHFAFAIAKEDVPSWQTHLKFAGVPIESTVHWPAGAVSLYFRDPDAHLVELVTPGSWPNH